ncbi:hypothetical protein GF339_00670, partial [candidate division KSB3 bacterium]|nr:hypothetical protein [candidate division KSB3 bacterium]MBD3323062.1 hypothetical protein [candidate division KSB3 bacterium]
MKDRWSSSRRLSLLLLTLTLLVTVGSCHWLEHDSPAPTAPGLSPLAALNYSSTGGSSEDEYQVRLGNGYIVLNIPTAGDYRIDYTAKPDASAPLAATEDLSGPYHLFTRQTGSALHQIGILEGYLPWEVCVTPGTITPDVSAWYDDNAAWLLDPGEADGHLWWWDETAGGQFVASGDRWCLAEEGGRVAGVAQAPAPVVASPPPACIGDLYVDVALGDDANACTTTTAPCQSVSQALTLAVDGNTICIAAGTYTEAELWITKSVTLLGAGTGSTTLEASGSHRVLRINAGVTAALEALTVQNGTAQDNCGKGDGGKYGGGICNRGELTLTDIEISGNTANDSGGLFNLSGTVTISGSVISGNTATYEGGGISNYSGTATLTNVTISGNTAGSSGGGICNMIGTLTISDSTLSGNTAVAGGGILNNVTLNLGPANSVLI